MKKITLTILLTCFSFVVWSQAWCGNSFITVNDYWYTGSNGYVHEGGYFNGANIGTFTTSSFNLGGELQVWQATDNPATLYYSIDNGSFTAISLPRTGTDGNNSKHYGSASVSLTGLSNGAHTIKIYFQAGSVYDNNGGADYVANFNVDFGTDVHSIDADIKILVKNGEINALFSGQAHIELYSITGQQLKSLVAHNEFSEKVHPGVYVLRINGKSHKVLVK